LSGRKRWYLLKSGLKHPQLGYTPHFKDSGNLEEQTKMHLLQGIQMEYDNERLLKEAEVVELGPGDVLYHPAGIWHAVECLETGVAINFSITQVRMADLIANVRVD